jgi:HlyD family secretion protein
MKPWKKIAIGAGAALLLVLIVAFTVHQSGKNVVTVQTGKVQREDLATVVSASGEIKPKTYVNIGANAFGKITHLYVKEGDQVKKGQLLAQLENVQSTAAASRFRRAGIRRRTSSRSSSPTAGPASSADTRSAFSNRSSLRRAQSTAPGSVSRSCAGS